MSHEKGIEAAARVLSAQKWDDPNGDRWRSWSPETRSIIAAYLAEAQPTSEGDSLRAALTRCHALLQDAGHWIDMDAHAEWHEAMDKELLPCDETAVCPTVATSEGESDRCDCGKSMEACAATEDCSGQSMPATSEGEEREAFEKWARGHFKRDIRWDVKGPYLVHDAARDPRDLWGQWEGWQARSSREGGKR